MGTLGNLGMVCVGAIIVAVVLGVVMAEYDRRWYKKAGMPLTRWQILEVAMVPSFIWIPALIVLALIVFVPSASAAELKRVPTGVVTLQVQPDTHFDITCADGTHLSVVTDGGSEGHGYCAPLTK